MINQTSEYALRVVVFLAAEGGGPLSGRAMADSIGVPSDYLTKVLRELTNAGLVHAKRGPAGGYTLLLSPSAISIYDVVSAFSALPRFTSCPLGLSDHQELCPLHQKLDESLALVEEVFRNTTIEELLPLDDKQKRCRFPHMDTE